MATSGKKAVEEPGLPANELNEPLWSVISFERCEASGLTHAQAVEKMIELECQNISGLCIVTDDAAGRIKPS
jgi:hypothetical protein